MRVAHELGKTLSELFGWGEPMSHLEFLVWHRWLEQQWQVPSRADWYAMQTAAEIRLVRNSFSKNPQAVRLSSMKIKFEDARKQLQGREMSEAEARAYEANFLARIGMVGDARAAAEARGRGETVGTPATPRTGITPTTTGKAGKRGMGSNKPATAMSPRKKAHSKPPKATLPPHLRKLQDGTSEQEQ